MKKTKLPYDWLSLIVLERDSTQLFTSNKKYIYEKTLFNN